MQLIHSELHWRFEHLRAHIKDETRLNNTSRHGCDLFEHDCKILVSFRFVSFRFVALLQCGQRSRALRVN